MSVLIASPVRFGLPAVPSRKGRCGRCSAEVWISRRARPEEISGVLCVVCAMAVVKPGDTIGEASWVRADLDDVREDELG